MTEQQKHLAETNHNLIYSFLRMRGLSIADWYDIAAIGLCQAAASFRDGESKFSTYAYHCMYMEVVHERERTSRLKSIPDYKLIYLQSEADDENPESENLANFIPSLCNTEDEAVINVETKNFSATLKPRDLSIFNLIMSGYGSVEIGKAMGCGHATVSRVKKRLVEYLNV